MYGPKCTGRFVLLTILHWILLYHSSLILLHVIYLFPPAMNKLVQNAIKNNKFKGPVAGPVGM